MYALFGGGDPPVHYGGKFSLGSLFKKKRVRTPLRKPRLPPSYQHAKERVRAIDPQFRQQLGQTLQQAALQQVGLPPLLPSSLGLPPSSLGLPPSSPQIQQCVSMTAAVAQEQKAAALQQCLAMIQQYQQQRR